MKRPDPFRALLGTLVFALPFAAAAQTDLRDRAAGEPRSACGALVAALERARAEPRVAQFLVDAADAPLAAEPVTFRIGDVVHESSDGFNDARRPGGRDPLVLALRAAMQDGSAHCEIVGSDTYRGAPVTRIRFVNPQVAAPYNPTTILIAQDSGLPVYHTYVGIGSRGFAWMYGDAPPDLTPLESHI
jgi:hypothetical protein